MCQDHSSEQALGREMDLLPQGTARLSRGGARCWGETGRPSAAPGLLREQGDPVTKMQLRLAGARDAAASGLHVAGAQLCLIRRPPLSEHETPRELPWCILLLKLRAYCGQTPPVHHPVSTQSSPGAGRPQSRPLLSPPLPQEPEQDWLPPRLPPALTPPA